MNLEGYLSGLALPHKMNTIIAGFNYDKDEIHILGGAIFETINNAQVSRWNTDLYYISTKYSYFNYQVDIDNNYTDLTTMNQWNIKKNVVPSEIDARFNDSMYCISQCHVQVGNKMYFIPVTFEFYTDHNSHHLIIYDMNTKSFESITNYESKPILPALGFCLATNNV